MAVQAMQQVAHHLKQSVGDYKIRSVDIMNALVVPDTAEGVEVQFSLSPCSTTQLDDKGWWDFDLYSMTAAGDAWTKHCSGSIFIVPATSPSKDPRRTSSSPKPARSCSPERLGQESADTVDPAALFADLRSRGVFHGPSFQNLVRIGTGGDHSVSTFGICKFIHANQVIHPTTLDSIFLAAYASLGSTSYGTSALVPRFVEEIIISRSMSEYEGQNFKAQTTIEHRDKRGFRSSIKVSDAKNPQSMLHVEVRGLYCQAISSMPTSEDCAMPSYVPKHVGQSTGHLFLPQSSKSH